MSSLRSLIRDLLQEGPLEKMRNSGVPAPIAEFVYEFLPDEFIAHSLWFIKQMIDSQHQFEDNFKRTQKELARLFVLSQTEIAVEFPDGGFDIALVRAAKRARRAEKAYRRHSYGNPYISKKWRPPDVIRAGANVF